MSLALEKKLDEILEEESVGITSGAKLVKSPAETKSEMKKAGILKRIIEAFGTFVGYVKGRWDGIKARLLSDPWNDNKYNLVGLPFDNTGDRITNLPEFFGGSSPIISPGAEREAWRNLCESLGLTAQKLGPLAGLTLGLAGGAIISSVMGYIKDRRILKDMKELLTPADYSKASKFTKLKATAYAIKSIGLGFIAYLTIKFVYSFISTLLGLNSVPDVINTVEEANFWAKFVYDTIMTAKDLAPIAEYWAPKLLAGAAGTYAAGTALEIYEDKKIKEILEKYEKDL